MSMTIKEWTEEAAGMATDERKKRLAALRTLQRWPAFRENYGWTGFETLAYILKMEAGRAES